MKVGFVGWRGMVGSVLMERMLAENDFNDIEPVFFDCLPEAAEHARGGLIPPGVQLVFNFVTLMEKTDSTIVVTLVIPIFPWFIN